MSGMYEGDIIRPLGLVTLYCGYAELVIDGLLDSLTSFRGLEGQKRLRPVGQKLAEAREIIEGLHSEELSELIQKLDEAVVLFDRRNALVHNAIFSSTSTVTSLASGRDQPVTPEALTSLAHEIFNIKEHIDTKRQRDLEPILTAMQGSEEK